MLRKKRQRILIEERKIRPLRVDAAPLFRHYLAKKKRRSASSLALIRHQELLTANSHQEKRSSLQCQSQAGSVFWSLEVFYGYQQ